MKKSEICRLGLVDDGEAYIVPVNYAYEDGHIYIHSAPHGRKIDLLRKNNKVSFEIEHSYEIIKDDVPCRWTAKYRSVMGKGTISIESDLASKKNALDKIMKKYDAGINLVYDESSLSRIVILKLKILSVTGKQSGDW
ncbi:MAG TPA: pyridoxamine 5'-phosphate oxidase family protein [Bacteroidales bacterium]|nr:pyridoxamine 5'-phosphate oxidase family protein [Bacteroidales bacterium]